MATLKIEAGDCEFHGSCGDCDKWLGVVRPDQSFDLLGNQWDLHVNTGQCPTPAESEF